MTGTAATARVWLAVAGVALGTWIGHDAGQTRLAWSIAAVGASFACARRMPVLSLLGIVLVTLGVATIRAEAPVTSDRWQPAHARAFRSSLTQALDPVPDRAGALLAGLTIGDTSGVDHATTEAFRRSGLAHLVAVSGSNVAMVLAAIAVLTMRLPLFVRGGIAAVGLAFYVAVVGPDPSVLRAAAMGIVGLVAYVAGRNATSLNSLGIALIAVVAAKPELLWSIGLHLSAAATLGIVVWASAIERRLRRLPAVLRAPVAITLSAQIAVAPLLIVAFGELSLVAPVANVLAAPAVPPATVIGLASGVAAVAWTPAGEALAHVAAPFAGWILWVADHSAGWRWASIGVSAGWGWALAVPVGIAAVAASVVRTGR